MSDDTDDLADKARVSVADAVIKLAGSERTEIGLDQIQVESEDPVRAIPRSGRAGTMRLKY